MLTVTAVLNRTSGWDQFKQETRDIAGVKYSRDIARVKYSRDIDRLKYSRDIARLKYNFVNIN